MTAMSLNHVPAAAPEHLFTRREAAAVLRVSLSTVEKLISSGRLPVLRFGRIIRVRSSDVIALTKLTCHAQ